MITLFRFLQNLSARLPIQISNVINISKYHAVTINKSEKKSFLIQFYISPYNDDWGGLSFKMFKRNISSNERKKEIITKTWAMHDEKVDIKKKGKVDIMDFWE